MAAPEKLEIVISIGAQGQRAAAGFCLGGIITNRTDNVVANLFLDNRSADVNPPGFKINVGPAEPQGLRAAQAVEAGQKNRDSYRLAFGYRNKLRDFINATIS